MFVIVLVALTALLAMKVVPTIVEYSAIKRAIMNAAASGTSVRDIQLAFDRQRDAAYIDSVSGKDLEITKTSEGFEVNVVYQKKIGLVGPASLVIDYVASTGSGQAKKTEQ
ncbi:MAG TPA: DUF4845 domain-containing protein [Noviherbaspirillum sp.]